MSGNPYVFKIFEKILFSFLVGFEVPIWEKRGALKRWGFVCRQKLVFRQSGYRFYEISRHVMLAVLIVSHFIPLCIMSHREL